MILTVGRFSYMKGYGKGFDVLMNAMPSCPKDCSLYIVGGRTNPGVCGFEEEAEVGQHLLCGIQNERGIEGLLHGSRYFLPTDTWRCMGTCCK